MSRIENHRNDQNQEKELFRWNEGLDLRRKKSKNSCNKKKKIRTISRGIEDYFSLDEDAQEEDDLFDDQS